MEIKPINHRFSICSLEKLDGGIPAGDFCFTAKTDEECSLVCPTELVPPNPIKREDGWRAFRIQGMLDFSLIGILAEISTVLAENRIGIFAVSTFNTDYIFVKEDHFDPALHLMRTAGYAIAE